MKIIDSITIRYFRSIYTLTISPCSDEVVITGKNDVGKSNILKALNLFFCNQSDYLHDFNFSEDYSLLRKEEVQKDTIRGQRFISISIRFRRGEHMPLSLPPYFTVTKRWDMHSMEAKTTSDVQERMKQYAKKQGIKYSEKTTTTFLSTFLNRIRYIYVPAVKDANVFNESLSLLQQNLFNSKNAKVLDAPFGEANNVVQEIVGELQADFQRSTGIQNFIELPTTLNYTKGLLQVITNIENGSVTIEKRGDGIRNHYIPKILNYVASHSKKMFIWGFEEPENSYEYRKCIQVANEFDEQYSKNCQIFMTSHSPAFFNNESERKVIFRVASDVHGKTIEFKNDDSLDEELGYIELYRDFVDRIKFLQKDNQVKNDEIGKLKRVINKSHNSVILTEGITDAKLLKLAIRKLGLTKYEQWEIHPVVSKDASGNMVLSKFLMDLCDNIRLPSLVIGMFDRDAEVRLGIPDKDIRTDEFVKIADKVYAFAIPVPHDRSESNQISIEHYFTDREIKTEYNGKRLYLGNEFYPTGVFCGGDEELFYKGAVNVASTIKIIEHEQKNYVMKVDGTGDYSISKSKFVECIENGCDGFSSISFEEFRKIFSVIDKIENDSKI